jgi:HEAT repeat protein
MEDYSKQTNFTAVLAALQDTDQPFPAKYLTSFSDLHAHHKRELMQVWNNIPPLRKVGILEDLEDLLENDTLLNFDELAKSIIKDEDPRVRIIAIRLLWECEDARIIPELVELMRDDLDEAVRATAAALIGKFVLLGELDRIKDEFRIVVVKHLLEVVQGTDSAMVRQQALESLGYSSHPSVVELIKKAFESNDPLWTASALCAMGRSADELWEPAVLAKLESPIFEVQYEAIRAAGELELGSSRDTLISLLDQDLDDELHFAAIWSLAQIGGDEVKEKFEGLLETSTSEDEIELLEKALENLEDSFFDELDFMSLSEREKNQDPDNDDLIDEVDFDEFLETENDTDEDEE